MRKNKAPAKAQPSITSFFSIGANSTSVPSASGNSDEISNNSDINAKRKFESKGDCKKVSEENKKKHNRLNNGQYSNSDDQIVPSIQCSPSKRIKLSDRRSTEAGQPIGNIEINKDVISTTKPVQADASPRGNKLRMSPRNHRQNASPGSDNEVKKIFIKTPTKITRKEKQTSARKALNFIASSSALKGKFNGSVQSGNGSTEEGSKEKYGKFNLSISPNMILKDSNGSALRLAANSESSEHTPESYTNILETTETCDLDTVHEKVKMNPFCRVGNKQSNHNDIVVECKLDSNGSDDYDNMFGDWDGNGFSEFDAIEKLDLKSWQRCYVEDLIREPKTFNIGLKLKEEQSKKCNNCVLEGIWRELELNIGDLVSIIAHEVDDEGLYHINNTSGFLVQQPDTLISSTTIVGSIFCKRKAVLQDRFKGIDCSNKAMTMGSFIHELLQISLKKNHCTAQQINTAGNELLQSPNVMYMLYAADMSYDEACLEMSKFVPQIVSFIQTYVVGSARKVDLKKPKADWNGKIDSVLDIEENIWSPKIGVKGKIDVTLQVTIHDRNKGALEKIMPLELKTGKASGSAEHRGQVILYLMMMSLNQVLGPSAKNKDLTEGLLLYLRDTITIKEVSSGHHEQRDLLMLRNQLAPYLVRMSNKERGARHKHLMSSSESDCTDHSEPGKADEMPTIKLPEPINHRSACGKCEYLTLCSLHLMRDKSITLNADHPLSKLKPVALSHITDDHMSYFAYWTGLLLLEDMEKVGNPLKDIWTLDPVVREKRGKCLAGLVIDRKVVDADGKYLHTFSKPKNEQSDLQESQFQLGEYLIVSTEHKIAVAAGCISFINRHEIRLALDRDLSMRNTKEVVYNLDGYESQNTTAFNMTNLGALLDDRPVAGRLRSIIIDKSVATFTERLPRQMATLGKRILASLNVVQQRAVLKALTADSYLLIKGMPGTGKTQTVVALIEMLVALGKSVLVTSQTHSAVDNVLLRLAKDLQVMRLGSSSRVLPQLLVRTEDSLTAHCTTPEQLKEVYDNVKVIGVTCFGAGHPLLTKRVFDVCLVDESTQVLQSTVLRPLFAAHKFVLIGDPEQLPPIVRSNVARDRGLSESLFTRLDGLGATVALTLQYRMNRRVMQLANAFTYEGQLVCGSDAVRDATLQLEQVQYPTVPRTWVTPCLSPVMDHSIVVVNTGNTHKLNAMMREGLMTSVAKTQRHCTNVVETVLVLELLRYLCEAGVKTENIGVIAPYRDQVAFLKKSLLNYTKSNLKISPKSKMTDVKRRSPRKQKDNLSPGKFKMTDGDKLTGVEVNTVDQYQGRDKVLIIYSCTRTWDSDKGEFSVKDTEILEDKRRLTVAITRAKCKLIIIGDTETLRSYSTFKQLFNCIENISSNMDVTKVILEPPGEEEFNSMFINFKSCLM